MAILRLPRLPFNWEKTPGLMGRYWDEAMDKLEEVLNAILAIPAIEQALQDLDDATQAALDAADAAQQAASSAQGVADVTAKETSLVSSYVSNFTAPLISASSTGTVTVATHDRVYGDSTLNPTVAVNGGSINTGEGAGAVIRVYYDDPSRSGGNVTYQYTVDPAPPPTQTGDTHSVGVVQIPSIGTEDGNYLKPPGWVEL